MPVRECLSNCTKYDPLKPHAYSYLNLSLVLLSRIKRLTESCFVWSPWGTWFSSFSFALELSWHFTMWAYVSVPQWTFLIKTVNILLVTSWFIPVSCSHFIYLWFTQQVWGLLSLKGIRAGVLTAHPKAQQGHMVTTGMVGVFCVEQNTFPFSLEMHFHIVCLSLWSCPKHFTCIISSFCQALSPVFKIVSVTF